MGGLLPLFLVLFSPLRLPPFRRHHLTSANTFFSFFLFCHTLSRSPPVFSFVPSRNSLIYGVGIHCLFPLPTSLDSFPELLLFLWTLGQASWSFSPVFLRPLFLFTPWLRRALIFFSSCKVTIAGVLIACPCRVLSPFCASLPKCLFSFFY